MKSQYKPFHCTTFFLHNILISTWNVVFICNRGFVPICNQGFVPTCICYWTPCDIYIRILLNTYFMQMSAPASLLLMSVVCVVLSQSRSTCPENQVLHSNGRCCQYVRCHPRKYITLLLSAFIMIINRLIDWLGSLIKIIFLIVMYCIVATIENEEQIEDLIFSRSISFIEVVPFSEHYVRICNTEGGADVCVPCGPNAYLDDPTDSYFAFDCLEKNCGEGMLIEHI